MDPRLSISSIQLEKKKPDQTLDDIGHGNCRLVAAVVICSLTWAVGAMQMMTSAFTNTHSENSTRTTLIEEFDLTGDKSYQSEWGTSLFMFGNMIGGSTLTRCADRYGRRPLLLLCLILQVVGALGAALSPNIYVFAIFRLIHGAFYTGSTMMGWVTAYEHSATGFRKHTTLLFGLTWVIGYCAVAPIAMFSNTWRQIIAICAAPILVVVFLGFLFIPETLHFLVGKKKTERVVKWMRKVDEERMSDVMLLMKLETVTELGEFETEKKVKKESVLREIFQHKIFIIYCLIQVYLWTCDNFIYFGLSLYSTQIAGNMYVNYLLMGVIEIPAYILTPILLDKFGRRPVVSISHFIAALSFVANLVFQGEMVMLFGWLSGKLAISVSFMSLFVYASEIFPTEIRSVSVGLCAVLSKIGAMCAPYIGYLGTISPVLPPLVLSSISVIAGFLTLFLPETKNKPLPSSISDPSSSS